MHLLPFPPYFRDSGVWVQGKLPLLRMPQTINQLTGFPIDPHPQLESYFTDSINSS